MASSSWAEDLVGRDWEIWWSENEGGTSDDKNGESPNKPSEMDVDKDKPLQENDDMVSNVVMAYLHETKNDPGKPEGENEGESESEGEGSVIDDWYAGRILSFEQAGESFIFKIIFVGDEQIYEMALDPTKVRPSAIAWIVSVNSVKCFKTPPPWYLMSSLETDKGDSLLF